MLHQILLILSTDKTSPCGKDNVAISSEVEPKLSAQVRYAATLYFTSRFGCCDYGYRKTIAALTIVRNVLNSVDRTKSSPMIKCVLHVVTTVL